MPRDDRPGPLPRPAGSAPAPGDAREGVAIEPVPAAVRDAARSAFADRDPGTETADLVADSLLHDPPALAPRRLRFLWRPVVVDVREAPAGQEEVAVDVVVAGAAAVEGPRRLEVTCVPRGGLTHVTTSEPGAPAWEGPDGGPWRLEVPAGLVRLTVEVSGLRVRTTWVRV